MGSTFAATVKEPHAERGLQRSDRIGNGRLGNVSWRPPYHAAVLNHGKEDVEVAASHATTNTRFPVRSLFHKLFVMLLIGKIEMELIQRRGHTQRTDAPSEGGWSWLRGYPGSVVLA